MHRVVSDQLSVLPRVRLHASAQLQTAVVVSVVGLGAIVAMTTFGAQVGVTVADSSRGDRVTPRLSSKAEAGTFSAFARVVKRRVGVGDPNASHLVTPSVTTVDASAHRFYSNVPTELQRPVRGFQYTDGDAAYGEALRVLQKQTPGSRDEAVDLLTNRMGGEAYRPGAEHIISLADEIAYRMKDEGGLDFETQEFKFNRGDSPWVQALLTAHFGAADYSQQALANGITLLRRAGISEHVIGQLEATYDLFHGGISEATRNQRFGVPNVNR